MHSWRLYPDQGLNSASKLPTKCLLIASRGAIHTWKRDGIFFPTSWTLKGASVWWRRFWEGFRTTPLQTLHQWVVINLDALGIFIAFAVYALEKCTQRNLFSQIVCNFLEKFLNANRTFFTFRLFTYSFALF